MHCRRADHVPGVHPRPRGAAKYSRMALSRPVGPSPLTRGSHQAMADTRADLGSIPAHAGQPHSPHSWRSRFWVHPRSRGAASRLSREARARRGPSPLTRGSLAEDDLIAGDGGSIPAHAGQPGETFERGVRARVHPRSRGAASACAGLHRPGRGPSPLTRGSRFHLSNGHHGAGSIPAHAGQPMAPRLRASGARVHPRSRGAAGDPRCARHGLRGPSPLTRGSLHRVRPRPAARGSIPAHAGQPLARSGALIWIGVHPRSRGAACARG